MQAETDSLDVALYIKHNGTMCVKKFAALMESGYCVLREAGRDEFTTCIRGWRIPHFG